MSCNRHCKLGMGVSGEQAASPRPHCGDIGSSPPPRRCIQLGTHWAALHPGLKTSKKCSVCVGRPEKAAPFAVSPPTWPPPTPVLLPRLYGACCVFPEPENHPPALARNPPQNPAQEPMAHVTWLTALLAEMLPDGSMYLIFISFLFYWHTTVWHITQSLFW